MKVVLPAPRKPATISTAKGRAGARERRLHFHSRAAGSGSTRNQCSRMASAIIVPRNMSPTRAKAVGVAVARWNISTAITVEIVMEKGKSRFIGRLRRKLFRKVRCSGRNSSLRLRTPRKTLSLALWCIHHSTMKVQVPIWFGWPQVRATTRPAVAMIASSCHRLVCTAWPKCRQPAQFSGQGARRGPVT